MLSISNNSACFKLCVDHNFIQDSHIYVCFVLILINMEKIINDDEQKSEKSKSRSRSRSGSKEKQKNKQNKNGIKNFDQLVECFKESRKDFLFKVSFEDGFFYGKNARNYLLSILNRKLGDDGKIIEEKRISITRPKEAEFFYFRVNKEICIKQVYIQSIKKEELPVMKIQQMRPQNFFDDI